MAWIKVDPFEIVQLKKFHDFRVACGWHSFLAQGALYSFWGKVAELRESGEISDWTPDYLAELIALVNIKPQRFWDALLQNNDWIEARENGQLFVRDWIDIAGPYLYKKYHTSNHQKLAYIYGLHGRRLPVGKRTDSDRPPQGSGKEVDPDPEGDGQGTFREPKGNLKETESNERNKRTISSLGFKSPPFPLPPPLEDLKALISDANASRSDSSKYSTSEKKKKRPEIPILVDLFHKKLCEKRGEAPADWDYGRACKEFDFIFEAGYTAPEIADRFTRYFDSTDSWIVKRGYCAYEFRMCFNKLKDGPISNQVGSYEKQPFNDGAATVY